MKRTLGLAMLFATIALCSAGSEAWAQRPDRNPLPDMLRPADTNEDRRVTREEFDKAFPRADKRAFKRLDKNDDGMLDNSDSRRSSGGGLMTLLRKADVNNDNNVTYQELKEVAPDLTPKRFERIDKTGDHLINREDLALMANDGNAGEGGDERVRVLARMYAEADSNADGKTTYGEITVAKPGFPRENFDRHDRNGDGVISMADWPTGRR